MNDVIRAISSKGCLYPAQAQCVISNEGAYANNALPIFSLCLTVSRMDLQMALGSLRTAVAKLKVTGVQKVTGQDIDDIKGIMDLHREAADL